VLISYIFSSKVQIMLSSLFRRFLWLQYQLFVDKRVVVLNESWFIIYLLNNDVFVPFQEKPIVVLPNLKLGGQNDVVINELLHLLFISLRPERLQVLSTIATIWN
jgi:hypothetical protein